MRLSPTLSILLGFGLAIFSLGVLIFFIHHVADSIQAMTIISNVSGDLQRTIERLFPQRAADRQEEWNEIVDRREIPGDFEKNLRAPDCDRPRLPAGDRQ